MFFKVNKKFNREDKLKKLNKELEGLKLDYGLQDWFYTRDELKYYKAKLIPLVSEIKNIEREMNESNC